VGSEPENDVALSPDGALIVGVGVDRQVRLWNARTGAQVRRIGGSRRELRSATFSSDGTRFAVGGGDGVTRVWSIAGGSPVTVLRGQGGLVYDVAFANTSRRLVSAGDDGNARVWDVGSQRVFVDPSATDSIDFDRSGRLILGASEDGSVRIWDAATGKLRKTLPGPAGYTYARFSPTAEAVIIGRDATSSVILWPLGSGSPRTIAKHPPGSGLYNVRLDGAGRRVVYVDTRGGVTLTDIRSGRGITLGGAPKDLYDVQISPDGRHAVGGTESGRLIVWRLDQPTRPERVSTGHRGHINSATYGPGGRIVSASGDRTIRVWGPGGGPALVLRGHDDDVMGAVFTHDGRRIISASGDGSVRLWDAAGGDALAVLDSGEIALYDLAVSPRGTIATVDVNNVVHVFPCSVCGDVAHVRALARSGNPRPLTDDERERFLAAAR
jgi:WD40 repeat protein